MSDSSSVSKVVNDDLTKAHEAMGVSTTNPVGDIVGEGVTLTLPLNPTRVYTTSLIPRDQYKNFFQREVKTTSGSFNGAASFGSVFNNDFIADWFLDGAVNSKLQQFRYWRGGFKIRIVLNIPAGAFGNLIYAIRPNGQTLSVFNSTKVSEFPNIAQLFQLDHVIVDYSQSSDIIFEVPFVFPADYALIDGLDWSHYMWDLWIGYLHPISNGQGATALTADYSIYVSATDDFEVYLPEYQGKISDSLSTLSSIAGSITAPSISSLVAPAASVLSGAAKIAEYFGYTRETAQKTPTTMVYRPYSNVANVDCKDTSEIAALSVSNTISVDPTPGGGMDVDETSFQELFKKWTFVQQFQWGGGAIQGDHLFTMPVTPFCGYGDPSLGTGLVLPVAGYVGLPFQYWRGDMEYKLLIPVSAFHRGTIQVYWSHLPYPAGPGVDITNRCYNQIFHVAAGQVFDLCVGYTRNLQMLENIINSPGYPSNPSDMPTEANNGYLHFRVVNPLKAQTTSTSTTVVIMARACKNMTFSVPRTTLNFWWTDEWRNDEFASVVQYQGAVGDEETVETCLDLVPRSAPYPAAALHAGEEFGSIRALVQKFTMIKLKTIGSIAASNFVFFRRSFWEFDDFGPTSFFLSS